MSSCCGGTNVPPKKPIQGAGIKQKPAGKFDLLSANFSTVPPDDDSSSPCCGGKKKFDFVLWISLALFLAGVVIYLLQPTMPPWMRIFSESCVMLALQSWWALLLGIIALAVLSQTPKELVAAILGRPGTFIGILRATAAGVLLDLCNHGILMVGMGLYKRGASLGQTVAFLIASPWNSFSLTLLLAALIGWKWMMCFLLLSALIGIATGVMIEKLTAKGKLPANPNTITLPADFRYRPALQQLAKRLQPSVKNFLSLFLRGLQDSRMILRWILLGFVLTGLVRALVPADFFQHHYGPTVAGLLLTLLTTTLLEVCSEGSAPLAAELMRSAHAPGNAFTFLMAGAATDYTEIMALRSTTGRWLSALALPLISVPQVLVLSYWLNHVRL
jgi:uncharacterized protein